MNRETVVEKVKQILIEQLGVDLAEVVSTAHIENDLSADSLDGIEIVMALEEEFGLEIPDEEAYKFKTVDNIIDYVVSKKI